MSNTAGPSISTAMSGNVARKSAPSTQPTKQARKSTESDDRDSKRAKYKTIEFKEDSEDETDDEAREEEAEYWRVRPDFGVHASYVKSAIDPKTVLSESKLKGPFALPEFYYGVYYRNDDDETQEHEKTRQEDWDWPEFKEVEGEREVHIQPDWKKYQLFESIEGTYPKYGTMESYDNKEKVTLKVGDDMMVIALAEGDLPEPQGNPFERRHRPARILGIKANPDNINDMYFRVAWYFYPEELSECSRYIKRIARRYKNEKEIVPSNWTNIVHEHCVFSKIKKVQKVVEKDFKGVGNRDYDRYFWRGHSIDLLSDTKAGWINCKALGHDYRLPEKKGVNPFSEDAVHANNAYEIPPESPHASDSDEDAQSDNEPGNAPGNELSSELGNDDLIRGINDPVMYRVRVIQDFAPRDQPGWLELREKEVLFVQEDTGDDIFRGYRAGLDGVRVPGFISGAYVERAP